MTNRKPLTVERARKIARRLGIPPAYKLTKRGRQVKRQILADAEADRAFQLLTERRGLRPNTLIAWLTIEAFSPEVIQAQEESFLGGPRIWPKLKRLSERLRRDAKSIEQINAVPFPSPIWLVWNGPKLPRKERDQVFGDFYYLPEILRWYARYLENSVSCARRCERQVPSQTDTERDALFALLKSIRQRTGKWYLERVAALVTAARKVAGRKGETRDTLRKRLGRHLRRLARTTLAQTPNVRKSPYQTLDLKKGH